MARKRHAKQRTPEGKRESAAEGKPEPKGRAAPKVKAPHERRKLPNWPVLILAVAAMGLDGFLAGSAWLGEALPYCTAGSGCDAVQSSRWAWLFGVPVAAWGFGAFAVLAVIATQVRNLEWHWKLSWTVALAASAVSLYLTAIAWFVLGASCIYCLVSTGIALALFAVVAWQSPSGLPEFTWPAWLAQTGGLAAVLVVVLHLAYSGAFSSSMGEEDPYLRALAEHLTQVDARFFGAQWCGRCQEQKAMFGPSAARLPYIECSPGGQNAPAAPVCSVNGVSAFPTWIIGERRYQGVLNVEELARYSRFVPPTRATAPGAGGR